MIVLFCCLCRLVHRHLPQTALRMAGKRQMVGIASAVVETQVDSREKLTRFNSKAMSRMSWSEGGEEQLFGRRMKKKKMPNWAYLKFMYQTYQVHFDNKHYGSLRECCKSLFHYRTVYSVF